MKKSRNNSVLLALKFSEAMRKWEVCKIGDVCNTISETYRGNAGNVVLINTSDVLEGRCLNHEKVPNKDLKGQFKKTFQRDDILYSEIRPANKRFAYIDFDPIDYIASTKLMVIRHNEKILPQYLFYILKSQAVIDELQMLAESRSGTFPQITFSELSKLEIVLPSPSEQARILAVLKSLDDKIENIRRVNENLEQQAQALFKSWFVDFEPYKDGEFVESELGMIPKGWTIEKVEDLTIKMASGGTPKSLNQDYYSGDIRWFSTKELKDCYLFDSEKHISEDALNNSSAKLFPANTVLMAIYASPTVGRLGILTNESSFNQAAVGLVPKNNIGKEFIFLSLLSERDNLNNLASGAAQQNLNVGIVKNYRIIVPTQTILDNFNNIVCNIFESIRLRTEQMHHLSSIRDTLLPKLMSGELRVPDTDLINEMLEKGIR